MLDAYGTAMNVGTRRNPLRSRSRTGHAVRVTSSMSTSAGLPSLSIIIVAERGTSSLLHSELVCCYWCSHLELCPQNLSLRNQRNELLLPETEDPGVPQAPEC